MRASQEFIITWKNKFHHSYRMLNICCRYSTSGGTASLHFPLLFSPIFHLISNSSALFAALRTRPTRRFLVTLEEAQPLFPFSARLCSADSGSLGLHLRWILHFPRAASLGSTQMEATSFEGTSAWDGCSLSCRCTSQASSYCPAISHLHS